MTVRGFVGAGIAWVVSLTPEMGAAEVADQGATPFQRTCAMCHGPDGRAATPVARRMGVKDLTVSALTDDQIRRVIEEGVKTAKGAMPAYRGKFSDAELEAIVAHVRGLRETEKPANP